MGARPIIIVTYLRVSTEEQASKGYSLPDQREACQVKICELITQMEEAQGITLEAEIVEFADNVGGDLFERPVLQQMREFVQFHRPTHFVCLDPDRFSRNTLQSLLVLKEIEAAGAQVHFVLHNYANTPEGHFFFTLRAAVAQFDKARILERTSRGARRKLRSGLLSHYVSPYGYTYDKETDMLQICPGEAAIVQQIFRWAASHLSLRAIRDRLNGMGIATKRGGSWHTSTLRAMLRNRTYIGQCYCNRFDCSGLGALRQIPRKLRQRVLTARLRPREEWILVRVPAIIEPDLFDRVHQSFRQVKRQAREGAGLLSGLVNCGLCGGAIHYTPVLKQQGVYNLRCINRFPCNRDIRQRPPKCTLPIVRAHFIEEQVWAKVSHWLTDPAEVLRRTERIRHAGVKEAPAAAAFEEAAMLQQQLAARRQEQARLLNLVARGVVDEGVGEQKLAELKGQLEALQTALAEAHSRCQTPAGAPAHPDLRRQSRPDSGQELTAEQAVIRAILAGLSLPERRTLLRRLAGRVLLLPGRRCEIEPFTDAP